MEWWGNGVKDSGPNTPILHYATIPFGGLP